MEETISLKELFSIIRKRWYIIITSTVVATLLSAYVSFFMLTPIYESKTQILLNQKLKTGSVLQMMDIQMDLTLVNTYSVIMKSPAILDEVKEQLNLSETVDELSEKITVMNEADSQVITVSVQDQDVARAVTIANSVASVFEDKINDLMSVDNVTILSKAEVKPNQAPIKPSPLLNVAIALVLGLMLGIGVAFLLEYLDNTIKTEEDIEKELGIPVLGVVTKMDKIIEKEVKRNTYVQKEKHVG